ncbi:MAG TPA: DUF3995 domain-containing protein [Devosiaceae bacterium]|nr:DUF3995 domain-containing protein [Devosiaceae bacterium]
MDIAAGIIAAIIGIALLAIALAHLLWSVGFLWPIRDEKLLARSVIGAPGIEHMPPKYQSFGVFLLALAACVITFSVADHTSGGLWLTLLALLAAVVFIARGALGYTAGWAARRPVEPFRTLDRKNYSPLSLAIGVGLLVLVVLRLL